MMPLMLPADINPNISSFIDSVIDYYRCHRHSAQQIQLILSVCYNIKNTRCISGIWCDPSSFPHPLYSILWNKSIIIIMPTLTTMWLWLLRRLTFSSKSQQSVPLACRGHEQGHHSMNQQVLEHSWDHHQAWNDDCSLSKSMQLLIREQGFPARWAATSQRLKQYVEQPLMY